MFNCHPLSLSLSLSLSFSFSFSLRCRSRCRCVMVLADTMESLNMEISFKLDYVGFANSIRELHILRRRNTRNTTDTCKPQMTIDGIVCHTLPVTVLFCFIVSTNYSIIIVYSSIIRYVKLLILFLS